jgi:branched-chain amino acid transport system ATP-binding protein
MALLEINDLIVLYGEIEALRGVSLKVDAGQVVTLLGSNGAGKSPRCVRSRSRETCRR